jgi:HUS1 checkpoint protein
VIPEKGSQVWSVLKIESVFETYIIQSASPDNAINLEVPVQALQRALKSAIGATSASLRLTKKDNLPMLCLTIVNNSFSSSNDIVVAAPASTAKGSDEFGDYDFSDFDDVTFGGVGGAPRERETIITQDIPVKVLAMQAVEGLHEPRTAEPDVHIYLPSLLQVKSISERFTRLAMATRGGSGTGSSPRLELSANMHGAFRIAIKTDALSIQSVWTGLQNPELDPGHYAEGSQEVREHPSNRMKELGGPDGQNEDGFSKVRIDGKDWSRVLSVGRVAARVIACFMNDSGLILYVYPPADEDGSEESCLTVGES